MSAWNLTRWVCASAVALVASASALGQNIVQNPSFETPSAGGSFYEVGAGGSIGAWTVDSAVDFIGGFWAAADGIQSVDMNAAGPGALHQDLPTVAGRAYRITFALAGNPFGYADKTMDVRWNGATVATVQFVYDASQSATNMGWQTRTVNVTATGATSRLAFVSTTGGMVGSIGFTSFYGPAIDAVDVRPRGCNGADVASLGGVPGGDGQLTADDVVVFLAAFFASDLAIADVATIGGGIGGDGQLTADDVIVFLDLFFAGCPS